MYIQLFSKTAVDFTVKKFKLFYRIISLTTSKEMRTNQPGKKKKENPKIN